ncbi:MAG: hypothetical protein V4436_00890 [Patescibacteria group bacterium]
MKIQKYVWGAGFALVAVACFVLGGARSAVADPAGPYAVYDNTDTYIGNVMSYTTSEGDPGETNKDIATVFVPSVGAVGTFWSDTLYHTVTFRPVVYDSTWFYKSVDCEGPIYVQSRPNVIINSFGNYYVSTNGTTSEMFSEYNQDTCTNYGLLSDVGPVAEMEPVILPYNPDNLAYPLHVAPTE